MQGLKTLKNFFVWDGSQIVIHNDPLLGCSQTNRIQFLFSVESFYFSVEESFDLAWDFEEKIIKIPPIPIVEHQRVNSDLLDNLTKQIDCPPGLNRFFLSIIQKIEKFQLDFKNAIRANQAYTSKEVHKEYLNLSANYSLTTIKSKTYFSSQLEYELDAVSLLKIKLTTSELGIRIDFQGTTTNSIVQLADNTTDSICFHFFADYFQFNDLMNEATYSHFQITKPTHSFVNSKAFNNRLYSDLCGPDLINQALLDCLSEKLTLKSFLALKHYYQLTEPACNEHRLDFSFPNSRPIGSLGNSYLFEPLLCSRPTPNGFHIPDFEQFSSFGLEVTNSQQYFRSNRSKDLNDYQSIFQMTCLKAVKLSIVSPFFPARVKSGKTKAIFVRPTVVINGILLEKNFTTEVLTVGDRIEIKSGTIDFS